MRKKLREIEEKEILERQQQNERKAKAAQILNTWMKDFKDAAEKRKAMNRERQKEHDESKKDPEHKHSWDKIISNVAIKENDYQGTKDVSRFRQSLLNKKLDEANIKSANGGLSNDIKF